MPMHPFETPTTARVREWKTLNGGDFAAMDRRNTVVLVTLSPLEVHGDHLPVMTDIHEAEGMALRLAERLCERHSELSFVHMPPLFIASDVVPQPGSVKFRPSTIIRVVEDLGRSLAAQGFHHVWISSFHGGPRHFVAIEQGCHNANKRHGAAMVSIFSLLVNILTSGNSDLSSVLGDFEGITREDLEGDTHGGAVETSLMLHLLGSEFVKGYQAQPWMTVSRHLQRQGLPPLPTGRPSLFQLMDGFRHKIKYFEDFGYAGKPSVASAKAGEHILETLSSHAADALSDVYTGKRPLHQCHSPLWKLRWVFTSQIFSMLFERFVGHRSEVW